MAPPIIWFGNAAKLLKSILTIPGSTSGLFSLLAHPTTTDYSLRMPAAQGGAGEVMANDGSGNMDWVSITPMSIDVPNATAWDTNYSFTPNSGAWGTISNTKYSTRRVGDSLEVMLSFQAGTISTGTAEINLPAGLTIDLSNPKVASTAVNDLGNWWSVRNITPTSEFSNGAVNFGPVFCDGSDNSKVFLAIGVLLGQFNKITGTIASGNTDWVSARFTIPISGWTANDTYTIGNSLVYKAPTISTATTSASSGGFSGTGSGTYTTPTSPAPLYIRVRMVGGGGGGGGSATGGTPSSGGTGGNTNFGTSLLTANGGGGGSVGTGGGGGQFGVGGTASINSPAIGTALDGSDGGSGSNQLTVLAAGGNGGSSFFGGAGAGGTATLTSPGAGKNNTGSGGGGAGSASGASSGGGGGSGGFVDALILNPNSSYTYAVGGSGAAGSGGTGTGGSGGGSGYIEVTEYYQ